MTVVVVRGTKPLGSCKALVLVFFLAQVDAATVLRKCARDAGCLEGCLEEVSDGQDDTATASTREKVWCASKCDAAQLCQPGELCYQVRSENRTWCVGDAAAAPDAGPAHSPAVLFLDRHAGHVLLAAGGLALLCLPPRTPLCLVASCLVLRGLRRLKRRLLTPASADKRNLAVDDREEEEEEDADPEICPLCGEALGSGVSGDDVSADDPHRASYLMRCGHTFGFACIDAHLLHASEACPVCGEPANFLHVYEAL